MRMNVLAAIRLAVQTLPATILSVPLLALAIQAIMAMEVYANLVLPAAFSPPKASSRYSKIFVHSRILQNYQMLQEASPAPKQPCDPAVNKTTGKQCHIVEMLPRIK